MPGSAGGRTYCPLHRVGAGAFDEPSLKLVVRAGAGYNTIDAATASKRGVYVANCPGKNSIAVAELAFGLMLALDRRIAENVISLRAGQWNKTEFSKARGLQGRTLGLIGMGRIAQDNDSTGAGLRHDRIRVESKLDDTAGKSLGVELRNSLLELAADADIVSLHLALVPETCGLIGADFFNAMR